MKSHSRSEVRGIVVTVFTHSDCDYGPSKVMPSMEPMGQLDRRPLLVHGFTLSALNTRVELPYCDAEHHKDAPLLPAGFRYGRPKSNLVVVQGVGAALQYPGSKPSDNLARVP
jgi:hypothetical protein